MNVEYTTTFEKLINTDKKFLLARGGTRAGKTYAIVQILVVWLITGKFRGKDVKAKICAVVRKTLPALKATALRDFEEVLEDWGVYHRIAINRTDRIYSYQGREIEFFSVDDQQKVRGRKRDILYCNEANELHYKTDFFQLLIRTNKFVILDLNPSDPYNWVKVEIEDKRQHTEKDVDVVVTTYKDNEFLQPELAREIEGIKDPDLRKVYVLGEYGAIQGIVFDKITVVDSFPEDCKKVAIGLDFGYTNDPTAAVKCGIFEDNIYLDELFYEYALDNNQIAKRLPNNIEVYCDSAEPKSIAELVKYGIQAYPTKKGADSIQFGIQALKAYNICITARSLNLLKEQKLYKYKTDPSGNATNKPIDDFNHAWDAARYYAIIKLTKPENEYIAY